MWIILSASNNQQQLTFCQGWDLANFVEQHETARTSQKRGHGYEDHGQSRGPDDSSEPDDSNKPDDSEQSHEKKQRISSHYIGFKRATTCPPSLTPCVSGTGSRILLRKMQSRDLPRTSEVSVLEYDELFSFFLSIFSGVPCRGGVLFVHYSY